MSAIIIRPAQSSDLSLIASFIAGMNTVPEHRCLHCDEDVDAITRSIGQLPHPPEHAFVVAEQGGEIVGVLGCDTSIAQRRGWLWGPFASVEPSDEVVDRMYEQLVSTLPDPIRQLDDFMDLHNRRGIAALEGQGFVVRGVTHVYEAIRPPQPLVVPSSLGDLRDPDADAFRDLHDAIFPGTYKDGAQVLAERDADHRIFAYYDDGLLGYLYASPSEAEDGGYIHYVGVREDVRGRGIGYQLVMSALHWMFEERGFVKVSLTVADTHEKARALYERASFHLLYTGVSQRKTW